MQHYSAKNILYVEEENNKNQENNNYLKLFNMLNIKENKDKTYEREIQLTPKNPQKNIKKGIKFKDKNANKKIKNYWTQKSFRNFKEESINENEEISDYKNKCKEESKFKKKKSNLTKFKNIINKMRDMPIEEYMTYIENFYGYIERNENNGYYIDDQTRINNFLESMRKNIEKFKGRQNILQINSNRK